MTTPRTRPLVSLFVTVIVTLGACVSHPALDGPAPVRSVPLVITFHNDAREYVHVYLIGDQRQWLLGRVEPGAIAMFHFPASLSPNSRFVQLAAVMGEHVSLRADYNPHAMLTIVQPASAIVSQQWRFIEGQLTAVGLRDQRPSIRFP